MMTMVDMVLNLTRFKFSLTILAGHLVVELLLMFIKVIEMIHLPTCITASDVSLTIQKMNGDLSFRKHL